MTGKIDDREQQVADLLLDALAIARGGGVFQLIELLVDLEMDALAIRPVEADAGRPLTELLRPLQRR